MFEVYQEAQRRLHQEGRVLILTHLAEQPQILPRKWALSARNLEADLEALGFGEQMGEVKAAALRLLESWQPQQLSCADGSSLLLEGYRAPARVFVFGAGTVSTALVPVLAALDFAVTVIDDRLQFANPERLPQASRVLCRPFEGVTEELDIGPEDYVLIITRGHQYDRACLEQLLPLPRAYLGMIGSRSRVAGVRKLMRERGFSEEQLADLTAPIGLNIGAIGPEEIAISIAAQLICQRRLGQVEALEAGQRPRRGAVVDMDMDVLQAFAEGAQILDPQQATAILTILEASGSVPRVAGAKMLLQEDGRMVGSVGGGCSEGEALQRARDLLDAGGHAEQMVYLNNSAAAEAGMACGGKMRILIEAYPAER